MLALDKINEILEFLTFWVDAFRDFLALVNARII